ncbi:MAG: hypothetical protein AAGG07_03240 [Planctomycetota bacterium]
MPAQVLLVVEPRRLPMGSESRAGLRVLSGDRTLARQLALCLAWDRLCLLQSERIE